MLRAAAHEAGALDENDAIALLPNRATLRESKNQAEDVKQAFADLKSRKPYLFQQGAPAPQDGAGPQPGAEPQEPTNPIIVPKPRSQGGNAQPTLQDVSPDDRCRARMALAHPQSGTFPAALCFGESCTTLTR